jgi:hypothetical protein
MFKRLIQLAHSKAVITPLTIFIDEIQEIAPAVGHAFDSKHEEAAKWMAMNMKMVRSLGIRIIGATHDLYELRKGVRKEMAWQIPKQGVNYDRWEEPRLSKFNELWASLNVTDKGTLACIVRPDRMFSDKIEIPFYPRAEGPGGIGEIIYGPGCLDADTIKSKVKKDGPLPCDTCKLPHEISGPNMVCNSFMRIFDITALRTKGCEYREAKA